MGKVLLGLAVILGIAAGVFGGLVGFQSWEEYNSPAAKAERIFQAELKRAGECLDGKVSQCDDPNTPILFKIRTTVIRKLVEQGMDENCMLLAWRGRTIYGTDADVRYIDGFPNNGDGYRGAYEYGKFNKADGTLDKEKATEWVIEALQSSPIGQTKMPDGTSC